MDREDFIRILQNQCRLDLDQLLVAGVSGGPDSLCMLDLLIKSGCKVIVVHVNHQLRQEADQESQMVQDFCLQRHVKCIIGRLDISTFAKEQKISVEESARILRYRFLFEQAGKLDAQAVLVAHNADDQAETVLMHLLRGSGLSGLKGMQLRSFQPLWSKTIPLVRPLLTTSREEILGYCFENRLTPAIDQSNSDMKYFRNRIRHELLPELVSYNPRIKEHLSTMADVAGYEDAYLNQQMDLAWRECILSEGEQYFLFSRKKLIYLHPALLRRVLRSAIQRIDPNLRDVDYGVIDRMKSFLESNLQTNHLVLLADIEIIKEGRERLIICDRRNKLTILWPRHDSETTKKLNLDGNTSLENGWEFKCRKSSFPQKFSQDGMTCVVDAKKVGSLFVNKIQPGDRYSPFSLKGKSIKLSDFWTKHGLPERARTHWPLLKNEGGEIVWVPGFQISDAFKVTPETSECLILTLNRTVKED